MQAVAVVVLFSFFSPVWQWLEVGAQMNVKVEMRNHYLACVVYYFVVAVLHLHIILNILYGHMRIFFFV